MATLLLLLATAAAARLGDLARRDTGDIFTLIGEECGAAQCAEHGAGQGAEDGIGCACVCPQRAPLFREDRELCVDDLPECALATFGTGLSNQRIPFVYLPLKGQIIHPSREITFQNVKTPICAVSGAQFLTRKGFVDIRNTLDADVPFNLFRDEGRTFLQWNGENDVRARMTGRVMLVRLLCRDVAATPNSPLDLRGVFTPCVAFRVQGTPPKAYINVSEVQFAPNAHESDATTTSGLSISEYVAIGISSLLLGLIYIASVLFFLHIRKRRKTSSEDKRRQGSNKKDGLPITERDIIRINNERMQSLPNAMRQDDGMIKKNPLLSNTYTDHKGFISDASNISDSDDFGDSSVMSDDNLYHNQTTSALIHQHREFKINRDNPELSHRDDSGIERLPDEHVSIVETTDDREIMRPVGTTRRKLYFNPAYFEPQLMAEPPEAALEFLTKIREVISIAKHKMATKRFQPVLNEIPEEETYSSSGNNLDLYQRLGSQKSDSVFSLKRDNSRRKDCIGCPGCQSGNSNDMQYFVKHNLPSCSNCLGNKGDKQISIRKWLEDIPPAKQSDGEFLRLAEQHGIVNSMMSLPPLTENRVPKIRKQHSFTTSSSMNNGNDFYVPKNSGTMSIRSEPGVRNHNLPLPEFDNITYSRYGQNIAEVNDINALDVEHYFSGIPRKIDYIPKNNNVLPDMINEAVALDSSKAYNEASSSDDEKLNGNILDELNEGRHIALLNRRNTEIPSGNEYETDSLERNSNKKGVVTPTEYPDVPSSQASPSLSNALPLEEELTMRNAIYKINSSSNSNTPSPHHDITLHPNYYETIRQTNDKSKSCKIINQDHDYSLVSEVYVNNNYNFGSTPTSPSGSECSMGSKKLILTNALQEKPGCLTIEVKDPPENYIKIHESDGFEPDTLDRKHTKHKDLIDNVQFSRRDFIKSIENIENEEGPLRQRIKLRSSGTFVKSDEKVLSTTKFHSLRNACDQRKPIHDRPKLSVTSFSGSKSLDSTTDETWDEATEWNSDEGRILTLELRHSKRQRQSTPPTIKQLKNLARPDVLPPLPPAIDYPIYEQPISPPRKVENDRIPIGEYSKNDNGRSLNPRTFEKNLTTDIVDCDTSTTPESYHGLPCGPMRASVESQSSEYDNFHAQPNTTGNFCRTFTKRRSVDASSSGLNTNTFVKNDKIDNKPRNRQKKGTNVQDSGYLSSDSTNSTPFQRKLVVAKIVSCSESDDTENEARSESGAESVETHSVFFNCFREQDINIESTSYNDSSKSSQDD
ncbi:uncharacterized protein LOC114243469 [Bombyx mandarina]|uniref:Uncharacterized protein LOC114243469 n=1 Tax=Bombyx mandarina TaxID=7092 RepID=A0A6J2JMN5_BOMMA|nr:uncharacterized protein LOC114243469 [Bombyx mandarina]